MFPVHKNGVIHSFFLKKNHHIRLQEALH